MSARAYPLRGGGFVVACPACPATEAVIWQDEIRAGNWAAIHNELHHAPPIQRTRPNIRPVLAPHSSCSQQEWAARPRLGDVRQCHHGKLQVLSRVGVDSPIQGPGTNYWRDLSRIFDRRAYKSAARALGLN